MSSAVQPGDAGPQVEAGVGQRHVQHFGQHRRDLGELGAVQLAVGHHVGLVVPGRDAGRLHRGLIALPW
jgi:hypothetical protein